VTAATGPRELEQAVAELAGAEVYWALNEAKAGLWFEWWFGELVQAAADRVKTEAAGLSSSAWPPSRSAANQIPATARRSTSGRDRGHAVACRNIRGRTACWRRPCYMPETRRPG
jgi:hypothetical protein